MGQTRLLGSRPPGLSRALRGPWDLEGAQLLTQTIVKAAKERNLPLQANLNGGTHALALGLYLALEGPHQAHYLDGAEIIEHFTERRRPPWDEGDPRTLLALRGYRLEIKQELGTPKPDQELAALARTILNKKSWTDAAWVEDSTVKRFLKLWNRRFWGALQSNDREGKKGLLLEYLVYAELNQFLQKRGGTALFGGRLSPLGRPTKDHHTSEVDGLVYYRGELIPVECKLSGSNKNFHPPFSQALAERLGGSRGRALLIAHQWTGGAPPPPSPKLIYMVLNGEKLPEGVYRFPEDLELIFKA